MKVVQLLLEKGANYEHRNVSDYTPLSLAASGGYVNIIKLLLRAGADINSRSALYSECEHVCVYVFVCIGYTMGHRSMIDLHNRGPKAQSFVNQLLTV